MTSEPTYRNITFLRVITDSLPDLLILLLIAFFILLYASVLTGWFKPISDLGFLNRIEPIIFLIVGYYFGRLPSERNEKVLKEEISRQTHKADAATQLKERALAEREVVEERIRNVRSVLLGQGARDNKRANDSNSRVEVDPGVYSHDGSVSAAVNILTS